MSPDAIAAVWKRESAVVVAVAARILGDLGLAEEVAQDALVAALEQWPRTGPPDWPGAWLVTTAKNRALNVVRHRKRADLKHEALRHEVPDDDDLEAALDDDLRDDVLRLVFTACHPVLSREARVALTLRLVCGLTTPEIARAYLAPEPTVAQRIVRAKRTLADAGVPFEVPRGDALAERLASVLEVVYLVFNEGYGATAGPDLVRPALVDEALRLGRRLADLAPTEPEVLGLVALMELQASRLAAPVDERGEPVLLPNQDRSKWDRVAIHAGLAALARAETLATTRGPYLLQAALAACHARAATPEDTDWRRIADLYAELARVSPSPVVELNRAVAVSKADGPAAGLARLDALAGEPLLARYAPYPAARAELLEQLGRADEARAEFERAASLTHNDRLRARLLARASASSALP
jgi:RNA polymerase sigma factor (sigma-70 family)